MSQLFMQLERIPFCKHYEGLYPLELGKVLAKVPG